MTPELWHPLNFLSRDFHWDFQPWINEIKNIDNFESNKISIKKLDWDSSFFNSQIFKIQYIDNSFGFNQDSLKIATSKAGPSQYFLEIPSEAVDLFPALVSLGFSLVETRLTYFHVLENIQTTEKKTRFAKESDVKALKAVASGAINSFDRYHADPFFSEESTSNYLETYIENCIKGFAEKVFVPDLGVSPASFAALSRLKENCWKEENPLFRIPLTACLPENKGWHFHLCLAALWYAKLNEGKCLIMTTQSTNRAVIHNCEKLGFKFGSCFHIFSKSIY